MVKQTKIQIPNICWHKHKSVGRYSAVKRLYTHSAMSRKLLYCYVCGREHLLELLEGN